MGGLTRTGDTYPFFLVNFCSATCNPEHSTCSLLRGHVCLQEAGYAITTELRVAEDFGGTFSCCFRTEATQEDALFAPSTFGICLDGEHQVGHRDRDALCGGERRLHRG